MWYALWIGYLALWGGIMAETEGTKPSFSFPRVLQYLRDGFIPHTRENSVHVNFRAFTKWYFDFIKNLITVGALSALLHKTHSATIFVFSWLSQFILAMYMLTYLYRFNGFHIFSNSRLVTLLWVVISVFGMLVIQYVFFQAIFAIVF
jgi:hypothetical protein